MTEILWILVSCSAAGTVLAAFVWLLTRLASGKLSKVFLHLAWLLVWLRFALPIPGLMPLGLMPQTVPEPMAAQPTAQLSADAPVVLPAVGSPQQLPTETAVKTPGEAVPQTPPEVSAQNPVQAVPQTPAKDPQESATQTDLPGKTEEAFPWVQLLFAVWLAGALGSLAWHLFSYARLTRGLLRSAAEPDARDLSVFREICPDPRLRLLVHTQIGSALHLGLVRPTVLLPEEGFCEKGKEEALRLILLHEYTHYRRGDLWLKWFAMLTACLHWFNPAVYWILREWNEACEFACDEAVLTRISPEEQILYGETILETHRKLRGLTRGVTASFLGSGRKYLRERILYIADFGKAHARHSLAWGLVLLAALLLCACILGPVSSEKEEEDLPLPGATATGNPMQNHMAAQTTAVADATPVPAATFPPFTMPGPAGDRPRATLAPDSELALLKLPEGVEDMPYPEIPTWKYTLQVPPPEQIRELAERSAALFFDGKAQKTENEYKLPDRDTEFGPFYEGLDVRVHENNISSSYNCSSLHYSARWLDTETTPYRENMEPVDLNEKEAVQIAWEFLQKMGWDVYASGDAETIERDKEWDIRWKKLSLSDGQYYSIIIFMINGNIYAASLDISNLVPVIEDPPEAVLSLSEALYCLNYARSQAKQEDVLFSLLHDYPVLGEVKPVFAIDSMAYTRPGYNPDGPVCYVPCWRFDMKPLRPYSPWIRQTIYVNALTGDVMTDTNAGGWSSPYQAGWSTAVPTPTPVPVTTFPPFTMPGPAGDRPRATLAPDSELPLLKLPEGVEDMPYPEIPYWKYEPAPVNEDRVWGLAERSAQLLFEGKAEKTEQGFALPNRETEFGLFREGLSVHIPGYRSGSIDYYATWVDTETTPYYEMDPVEMDREKALQIAHDFVQRLEWDVYTFGEAAVENRGAEWIVKWNPLVSVGTDGNSVQLAMIHGHIYRASLEICEYEPVIEDPPEYILSLSEALYCLNYARSTVRDRGTQDNSLEEYLHQYRYLHDVKPVIAYDFMATYRREIEDVDHYVPCWQFTMCPGKTFNPNAQRQIYVNALTGDVNTGMNVGSCPSPYSADPEPLG